MLVGLVVLSLPAAVGGLLALVMRSRRWSGVVLVVSACAGTAVAFARLPSSLVAPSWADVALAFAFGVAAIAALEQEGGS